MIERDAYINIRNINKFFDSTPVLNDVNLDIHKGEFLTVFGPNGCGKSTLLNIIAGVEPYDDGKIDFQEEQAPRFGFIFQDYRGNLMPWLTVAENIAFPLRLQGVSRDERMSKVKNLCDRFGFQVDLSAHTYSLSGGQAQLTSILRALIIEPNVLILDEPFSALDYQTNLGLYSKLIDIWETTHITLLLVSHDLEEALYLGERTLFLTKRPGRVKSVLKNDLEGPKQLSQLATPEFALLKKKALDIFVQETADSA
jgi:NitT/TauT family transport system ATP-binding protein